MSDTERDYIELRREVLESRNQAIKTDNQLKNLILDIKQFEKRFDSLETRVRAAGIGVNLIIAGTIALAAFGLVAVRQKAVADELASLHRQVVEAQSTAKARNVDLERQVSEHDAAQKRHETASQTVMRIMDSLDKRDEKEAGKMLETLDAQALTPLEQRASQARLLELRRKMADAAYRMGRTAMAQGKLEDAAVELSRSLSLDETGRLSGQARYQLATCFYALKRYQEAAPLFRLLAAHEVRAIAEEAVFFAGASELRAGKVGAGRALLEKVAQSDSHFAQAAKSYLSALDQKSELPRDVPGGRVRVAPRRPSSPQSEQGNSLNGAPADRPESPAQEVKGLESAPKEDANAKISAE